MTNDEMRIAIAEACGWVKHRKIEEGHWVWFSPSGNMVGQPLVPDYSTDLNAMHEAEKILDALPMDKQSMYLDYLYCTVGWDDANNAQDAKFKCHYGSVRATAAQRAEAFLRTIGKWKD